MKRAFVFGGLTNQWLSPEADCTPIWIKFSYSSAYRVFCGPSYDVLLCGINYPYLLENGNAKPLKQLDSVYVKTMGCCADFIICACSEGKLLILRLSEIDNFTVDSTIVDYMNGLQVTHISVSNEDTFLLVNIDSDESTGKYYLLPEYLPFYQPINIVLAHIKNIPIDSTPHFVHMDQTMDSLNL